MLQSYIDVTADSLVFPHDIEQLHREMVRVSVMQPYPLHTPHTGNSVDKLRNTALTIYVDAIICQLLCYDIKLLHSWADKHLHFFYDILNGTALVSSCYQWYGAVGTFSVASLWYLDICIMLGSCRELCVCMGSHRWYVRKWRCKLFEIELAIVFVHLRNLWLKLGKVTLWQASHNDELAYPPLALHLRQLKDSIDALLFCITNKAASVHNDVFALRALRVMNCSISFLS